MACVFACTLKMQTEFLTKTFSVYPSNH